MTLAPWRSPLARALHRNRSLVYSRYVQLATVQEDGKPANRTVVFRGFLDDTNQLKFVADLRSEKSAQIQRHPWGELCWYFPKTREQFRFQGFLTLIDPEYPKQELREARIQQWRDLSDSARSQFAWPDPGKPRTSDQHFDQKIPNPENPLPNFCLLLLAPTRVDHLELRGDPQNRWLYTQDDHLTWSTTPLTP